MSGGKLHFFLLSVREKTCLAVNYTSFCLAVIARWFYMLLCSIEPSSLLGYHPSVCTIYITM